MPDAGDEIKVDVLTPLPPARDGGPRAWLVLLGTAVAAIVVIGGVFAFQAWQDDEEASAPTVVPVPETEPEEEALAQGNFLFRRVTADGIEVRARLNEFPRGGGGGIFMDGMPAATILAEEGTVPDSTAPAGEAEGFARPRTVPADTAAETATASPTTIAIAPRPIDPGIGGAIVDPEDLPPECEIVGDVMAWAISAENVAQGSSPWMKVDPAELYPSLLWDGFGGMPQNDPDAESIVGVVLQVPADVLTVRMRTAGGAADEMEPVSGAVVLAVLVGAGDVQDLMNGGMAEPAARNAMQITAERADGSVLTASLFDAMNRPHPAWGPECQPGMIEEPMPVPTTPLPDPGSEQPVDPAAARAEIEHNFSLLYGPRDPAIDRSLYIDDNFGFAEASAEVERNFPGAADGASVAIDDLVFVDASNAMFRYTLDTPAADFRDQLGRARLLDGVWKITRATLCQDMSHGGGMCPP